jgi:hypothetical protein
MSYAAVNLLCAAITLAVFLLACGLARLTRKRELHL